MNSRVPKSERRARVLITGVSGLLGSNLAYSYRTRYDVAGVYRTHSVAFPGVLTTSLDVVSQKAVQALIDQFQPDFVIHCAALTNVDFCEKRPALAHATNVLGTRSIAAAADRRRAKLVYISTDSVYDGSKGLFKETDPVSPRNCYGQTKYEGELEALRLPSSLVLRTNFFGWNSWNRTSLGEWMISHLKNGQRFQGFTDVFFSSMYVAELARLIDRALVQDLTGVYNCSSRDSLSKYHFGVALAQRFGYDPCLIEPTSLENSCLSAARPRNPSLDCGRLSQALRLTLPSLLDSIEAFHRDHVSGLPELLRACQMAAR